MRAGLSLTWKIAMLAILTLVMLTVVLLIFAGVQFRISPENFIVAPTLNRVLSVSGELAQDLGETPVESRAELLEQLSKQYDVDFYLVDGNGNSLTRTPAALPKEIVDEIGQRFRNGGPRPAPRRGIFRATTGSPTRYWVSVPIRWRTADTSGLTSGYLVVMSDSFIGNQFFFDPKPWLALTLALTIVFVSVWLPLIRSLTGAITEMTHATSRIAEGQFDTRLEIRRGDEVGQLASSINRMTTTLAGFVKGQKRFLADIAHELCAPIARMQMALGILEQNLPPEHFGTASILNNLARLYYRRARYTEAEPLYLRSLAILENTLGSDHPAVAESLRNLADLYRAEGRAGEAEALDQRSVVIRRAAHGSSKTCNDCP